VDEPPPAEPWAQDAPQELTEPAATGEFAQPLEAGVEPEPASDEPDRVRGRRRRGRRGGRGAPAAQEAEGPAPPEGESAEHEGPSDEKRERGRRRGRGRPRREEIAERPAEVDEEAASEEPVEEPKDKEDDAPDDDIDTLSDWNVPSWQELIASLYRPER
jgi:hypothetical protein